MDRSLLLRRLAVTRGCLQRIESKRPLSLSQFLADADAQDVVLRNLQVAIQACLDCASHLISEQGWELPGSSVGTFGVLARHGVLEPELAQRLSQALRLRNMLVHAYDSLSLERIYETYQQDLGDLEDFCRAVESSSR